MTCRRGLTLIEVLMVIVIVVALAALLFPVARSAMKASRVSQVKSNLHQLQLAAALYRTEHDGDGKYGLAKDMGLPSNIALSLYSTPAAIFAGTEGLWYSPCGQHPDTKWSNTNLNYHANDEEPGGWGFYASKKQEQSILFFDQNCTPSSTPLYVNRFEKVMYGVRLDGSLFNRRDRNLSYVDLTHFDLTKEERRGSLVMGGLRSRTR